MPSQVKADWTARQETCHIGSCHRHQACMYEPCRATGTDIHGTDHAALPRVVSLSRDPAVSHIVNVNLNWTPTEDQIASLAAHVRTWSP